MIGVRKHAQQAVQEKAVAGLRYTALGKEARLLWF